MSDGWKFEQLINIGSNYQVLNFKYILIYESKFFLQVYTTKKYLFIIPNSRLLKLFINKNLCFKLNIGGGGVQFGMKNCVHIMNTSNKV